ncbi:MAG: hypothetical protein ACYTAF_13205 [Planctomycetota bacterium]|jgi:hypothetical protein
MESEVLAVIELLKGANSVLWPALIHAAVVEGWILVGVGSTLSTLGLVAVAMTHKFFDEIVYVIGGFVLFLGVSLLLCGVYHLNTIEYQAYKMLF